MKKILFAEDNEDIREVFGYKIMSLTGAELVEMPNAQDSITYLREHPDSIELIIADHHMPNGNGDEIYNYIKDNSLNIHFILLTGDPSKEILNLYPGLQSEFIFTKPPGPGMIEEILEKLTNIDDSKSKILQQPYIPFSLRLLSRKKVVIKDTYIKLASDNFVLLYKEGTELDADDILKYQSKGVEKFYVRKEDFSVFLSSYISIIEDLMKSEARGVSTDNVDLQYDAHEIVYNQLLHLGVTKEVLDLSKQAVSFSMKTIKQDTKLKKLMDDLVGQGPWLYEHSFLLSLLSTMIIQNMEWNSDETLYKIHLAAFFHDITLYPEYDDSDLTFDLNKLSKEEIKKQHAFYYNHPFAASSVIDKIKAVPQEAITIITESHEKPDGTGFPKGLFARQTHILSCAFITAHTFLDYLYYYGINDDGKMSAFEEMDKTFDQGHYQKVYENLKMLMMPAK